MQERAQKYKGKYTPINPHKYMGDSGNIIYNENRSPISRATDQTEDIKIIVEF